MRQLEQTTALGFRSRFSYHTAVLMRQPIPPISYQIDRSADHLGIGLVVFHSVTWCDDHAISRKLLMGYY
jgi:hypothetical protein